MNPENVERKRVSELLGLAYTALDEPQGWNAENLDELRDAIGRLVARGGDMNNYERAVAMYEQGGQYAVYRAVEAGVLHAEGWSWCIPCEDNTPYEDDCCLVCGSAKETP